MVLFDSCSIPVAINISTHTGEQEQVSPKGEQRKLGTRSGYPAGDPDLQEECRDHQVPEAVAEEKRDVLSRRNIVEIMKIPFFGLWFVTIFLLGRGG